MNLDDHLRRHLADEAAALEPSSDDVVGVQRRARQRRRHAGLAGAFGVVALLAVGAIGYFAIFGDEESDNVETAPVSQSDGEPIEDSTADETDDEGAPEPNEQGAPEQPAEPQPAALEEAVNVREVSGPAWQQGSAEEFSPNWLVPWEDGFLSIRYTVEPVPFPELTDEQNALFPQEVLDLFEDSPAESVQDAYDRVIEAGLGEEALAVLEEFPELDQLIRGEQGRSVFEAWFTEDGSSWEPVEVEFAPPIDGYPSRIASNGEHLVMASELFDPVQGRPVGVQIASTADLQDWDVETVQATLPAVPDWAESGFWLSSLVVGTDGWAAAITSDVFADPVGLLPPDAQEELMMMGGLSAWSDEQGVHLQPTDCGEDGPCDDVGEEIVYTWKELGVDRATFEQYEPGTMNTKLLTRPWDEELAIREIPDAHSQSLAMTDVGTVTVVNHDYAQGPGNTEVLFSDWNSWTPLPLPAVDLDPGVMVWGLPGGILLSDSRGLWVGTTDGSEWTAITLPPDRSPDPSNLFNMMGEFSSSSGGLAMIVDTASYPEPDYEPVEFTVEADGYSLYSLEDPADGSAVITVTDLQTGDEVVSLTVDMFDGFEPDAAIEFGRDGSVTILDTETGEIIVKFPGSKVMEARDAIWAERETPDMDWPDPEPAVAATRDGYSWLVEPLGIDPNSDAFWMTTTAMNGNRVLVGIGSDYRLYELD